MLRACGGVWLEQGFRVVRVVVVHVLILSELVPSPHVFVLMTPCRRMQDPPGQHVAEDIGRNKRGRSLATRRVGGE